MKVPPPPFVLQFITGKIIHEFRESGWYENCQSLLQKTVQSQSYGLDREDIVSFFTFMTTGFLFITFPKYNDKLNQRRILYQDFYIKSIELHFLFV